MDTLTTISTLQRVKRNRVMQVLRNEVRIDHCLRDLPRGVSIADEFDERVEAARGAADAGEFDLYIIMQGGANVPLDSQTVRVARNVAGEVNAYVEDIERVVGIYAPHLGCVTRTAEWRIVQSFWPLSL